MNWADLIDLRLRYEAGLLSGEDIVIFYHHLVAADWLSKMPDIYKVQARILKRLELL